MTRARSIIAFAVMALGASCAAAPVKQAPPLPARVSQPVTVTVDVSGLFPASTSRTVGDARALAPGLLARVHLERAALTGEAGVEPWLSRALVTWLVRHGADVRANPFGASARLVGARFTQQREEVQVAVVENEGGGVLVRYWAGKHDESLCAPALRVPLTYVQLEAALIDDDERLVALLAEVVTVEPPTRRVQLDLADEAELCTALVELFTEELMPQEDELVGAADQALDGGFRAMVMTTPEVP